MTAPAKAVPPIADDEIWVRIPGLFRRLELAVEIGEDFHLEPAGTASDGSPLVAVYHRDAEEDEPDDDPTDSDPRLAPMSLHPVPLDLSVPQIGSVELRYCDVCRRWGEEHTIHVCGENWHPYLRELLVAAFPCCTSEITEAGQCGRALQIAMRFWHFQLDGEPDGWLPVRYCDICRRWGEERNVPIFHYCGENWHPRLSGVFAAIFKRTRAGEVRP